MSRVAAAVVSAFVVILIASLSPLSVAAAADYPSRNVTLIVPYPPGGGVEAAVG